MTRVNKSIVFLFFVIIITPQKNIFGQSSDCPNTPTQIQFNKNEYFNPAVISIPITETLNLYEQPGLNQSIIASIPPLMDVNVIDGPICQDGYRWYKIEDHYYNREGWVAEVGQDAIYNISPDTSVFSVTLYGQYYNYFIQVEDQIYYALMEIRRVPNIETLHALGIPESWVVDYYTQPGWGGGKFPFPPSNHTLGPDIPDVLISDPVIFCDYKNYYFRDTIAIGSTPCGTTKRLSPIENWTIIQIGSELYIYYGYTRRLIPNIATKDALGITDGMIDNMGRSDAELLAIEETSPVPDINKDPSGFQE